MSTLTISLTNSKNAMQQMKNAAIQAWKTGQYQGETLSYATPAHPSPTLQSLHPKTLGNDRLPTNTGKTG